MQYTYSEQNWLDLLSSRNEVQQAEEVKGGDRAVTEL